jgi:outer membrane lipase/esterase
MILSRLASPRWPRAVAGLLAAVALLVACGGGTTQYEPFVAKRVFAFGDDTSALTNVPAGNGLKYSVNGLDADGNIDCRVQPLWVQSVAAHYGYGFAECNPTGTGVPRAFMFAAAGAKVADLVAQVEFARVASGGFTEGDLATVQAGTNDIIEIYKRYPAQPVDSLLAEARARGELLARGVVNRLVDLGAKVIVSDQPNMGLTPYALAEKAAHTDTDRAALLTEITTAFNEQLGVKMLLDGRYVGLVQADLQFRAIAQSPASYGFVNVTEGVCTVPLPLCRTDTVPADANSALYLWADDTRMSNAGQAQLAVLAVDRAARNPF